MQASTGGGNIDIEIREGSVVARTGAGDIDVDVSIGLGDGDDGVELVTGHGNITLTVPGNLSIELDLDLGYTRNSSRHFEIKCDFDFDEEQTDEWDTSHSSPRKHIYGTATMNGGKHRVKVRTVNGNIRTRKQSI